MEGITACTEGITAYTTPLQHSDAGQNDGSYVRCLVWQGLNVWVPPRAPSCAAPPPPHPQYDPGFSAWQVSYTQTLSTTTLVIVRPLAHNSWPVSQTGPTGIVFASGTSNDFGRHGSNRAVRRPPAPASWRVGVGCRVAKAAPPPPLPLLRRAPAAFTHTMPTALTIVPQAMTFDFNVGSTSSTSLSPSSTPPPSASPSERPPPSPTSSPSSPLAAPRSPTRSSSPSLLGLPLASSSLTPGAIPVPPAPSPAVGQGLSTGSCLSRRSQPCMAAVDAPESQRSRHQRVPFWCNGRRRHR
jgi:hypothetical protein